MSDIEYTPTEAELRAVWGLAVPADRRPERLAEFDRFMAQVRSDAAAKALREAAVVIGQQATGRGNCSEGCHKSDAIVLESRARRIEQEGAGA